MVTFLSHPFLSVLPVLPSSMVALSMSGRVLLAVHLKKRETDLRKCAVLLQNLMYQILHIIHGLK